MIRKCQQHFINQEQWWIVKYISKDSVNPYENYTLTLFSTSVSAKTPTPIFNFDFTQIFRFSALQALATNFFAL